ncbi:MAG: DUF4240 domain-containing protein [Lawsonibacter sp.]|nr:DUF4240 domain-containing protein [Lawsonibacter sp.]
MDRHQFFWNTMERCAWQYEGNDDKVLRPVVVYLSQQDDDAIFAFHDAMSELLYALDTKDLAEACQRADPSMSDDSFLYSRCVALINGPEYYERVRSGIQKELWDMEFEALLYVPGQAWARKHRQEEDAYPHVPPVSLETGSNLDGWKKPNSWEGPCQN